VTPQFGASLTIVVDDTSKAKTKTNETFIVQASLTIITYDCKNMFIVQATGGYMHLVIVLLFFSNKLVFFCKLYLV